MNPYFNNESNSGQAFSTGKIFFFPVMYPKARKEKELNFNSLLDE